MPTVGRTTNTSWTSSTGPFNSCPRAASLALTSYRRTEARLGPPPNLAYDVDAAATAAFERAVRPGDVAGRELTESWTNAFGRDPDPSEGRCVDPYPRATAPMSCSWPAFGCHTRLGSTEAQSIRLWRCGHDSTRTVFRLRVDRCSAIFTGTYLWPPGNCPVGRSKRRGSHASGSSQIFGERRTVHATLRSPIPSGIR